MQYSILIYEPAVDFANRTNEQAKSYWAGWSAYSELLQKAGVMKGGAGLEPPTMATTVRLLNGAKHVHDGPYADTKEQLGGFYLIEAANLDEAMKWAEQCPAYQMGSIEIRPLMQMPNS